MWVLKKNLLGLALVVGAMCSAFAAEIGSNLRFADIPDEAQQQYWDYLMRYKIWGTLGVSVGDRVNFPDELGWTGTATGNFTAGVQLELGGPIILGGGISLGNQGDILTGPVRSQNGFSAGNPNGRNYFKGQYCIVGTVNGEASAGIARAGGNLRTGDDASTGACAEDKVPFTKTDLTIPVVTGSPTYNGKTINIANNGGIAYLDVPPGKEMIDLYYDGINFGTDGKLYVRMPPGGRLTRIFLKNFSPNLRITIQVVYVGSDYVYSAENGYTNPGDYRVISNEDYAGNLMFYFPNSITFDQNTVGAYPMQGTFISMETIKVANQATIAGQLLAKNVIIGSQFDGSSFRFVPFDPPLIGLKFATNQKLSENDSLDAVAAGNVYDGSTLNIQLDKDPETDVTFDYCFVLTPGASDNGSTSANYNDVDTAATHMPICGRDTASALILSGTRTPSTPIKVYIHDDKVEESREFFQLNVFNLLGGVFNDNSREWPVTFQILDNDAGAPCRVVTSDNSVTIPEDTPILLTGVFPATCETDGLGLANHKVIITSLPAKGSLTFKGSAVTVGRTITSDSLSLLKYTPAKNEYGNSYASIGFQINDPVEVRTTDPATLTINVDPVNDAPTATGCDKTLNEGVNKGTAVCTVSASDVDDATGLTYSIIYGNVDDENGVKPFVISSTGAITVNGKLDYERIKYYPLLVQVTDPHGASVVVSVNVTIADVDESPVALNCTGEVAEDALLNTYTGCWINASDPEGTTLKYEITGGTGKEKFSINAEGNIFTAAALDYETQSSYTLTITVKDKNGASGYKSTTATATITVTDVNEPPAAPADTCWIKENTKTPFYKKDGTTTKTCSVAGSDPEGKSLTYSITAGNTNTTFAVNSSSGVVTASKAPDFETTPEFPLVISVSDGVNEPIKTLALIKVIDVNEAPTAENTSCTIAENSPINLVTPCWIEASDQDGDALTYSITSATQNGADYFRVDEHGNIVVKALIDYDALSSDKFFVLTVTVSDGRGKTKTATATVNITDENEPPSVTQDTCWIKENTKTPFYQKNKTTTKTCKVTGTDPEGKTLSYSISAGNTDSTFAISSAGVVTASKAPNFEDVSDYTLVIDVSDGTNSTKTAVLVHVIDVNERPTAEVETNPSEVPENSSVNTYVTWVNASDIEDGLKLTYSIVAGNENGAFTIKSSGVGQNDDGEIRVAKDIIDFETKSSYSLTIRVCDLGTPGTAADTLCVDVVANITVKDGNEKPTITGIPDQVIDEHTPVGTPVGTVTGTDPEDGDLTFSFAGGNNGQAFAIDPTTGVITVARDIDFEALTDTVFKIKVLVVDNGGLRDETFVNIAIRDINEGAEIDDATMTVAENQPKGTPVGTLELYDQDTKNENRQNKFQAIGGDKDLFTIDATTGEIKTNAVFDYEAKTSYSLVVRVYDQDGNADTATVKINIADVKESSNIVVTYAETGSGAWSQTNPVGTLYVNENTMLLQWTADGKPMPDTLLENLHEGYNVVTLTYTDPTKNKGVTETVGIFVSTRTPEVTVTTSANHDNSASIYTLVETPAEGDTSVYVNKKNNDIVITVREPVIDETYSDSSCNYESHTFTVNTELEPVTIPSNTYNVMDKIAAAGPVLNDNPASEVTYSQYNKDQVKVSYTEKVAGVDVTISYVTDKDGNVEKIPVIGANGKIDSIEVITVSYQVNVGGKTVNVSYVADAITGQPLKTTTVNNTASNSGTSNAGNSGSNGGSGNGKPGSNGGNGGANAGANNGSSGGSGSSGNSGSGNANSGTGNTAPVYMYSLTEGEVLYSVTYDFTTKAKGMGETTVQVSYTVDQKGNVTKDKDGNVGYSVSYTYVNAMGNSSTQSVFIVVDLIPPKVKIMSPANDSVLHSNSVNVKWCVDFGDGRGCVEQDSLNVEGLQPGEVNEIVRLYRDKAGNEASDVVYVMAKNTKDVDISVEKPVTSITKEDVDKYYAAKEPEKGQTFAISIYNPQTDKEIETMVGGDFKNKEVTSGEEVYPGLKNHLGPTLGIQAKVPVINSVDGLATLDDLVGADGMILLDAVDAMGSKKVSVDEFVAEHCNADFKAELGSDISKANIYDTKMSAKIWVYTSLGQFVDYFSFTQELNDPSYASDAGVLTMYFEMKPDRNGDVHTANGRLYATGAYVYKTEITMKSKLRCDLPPFDDATNVNKMDQTKKVKEDLLKSFGYKRPKSGK